MKGGSRLWSSSEPSSAYFRQKWSQQTQKSAAGGADCQDAECCVSFNHSRELAVMCNQPLSQWEHFLNSKFVKNTLDAHSYEESHCECNLLN